MTRGWQNHHPAPGWDFSPRGPAIADRFAPTLPPDVQTAGCPKGFSTPLQWQSEDQLASRSFFHTRSAAIPSVEDPAISTSTPAAGLVFSSPQISTTGDSSLANALSASGVAERSIGLLPPDPPSSARRSAHSARPDRVWPVEKNPPYPAHPDRHCPPTGTPPPWV